jgi:hypothetical protein
VGVFFFLGLRCPIYATAYQLVEKPTNNLFDSKLDIDLCYEMLTKKPLNQNNKKSPTEHRASSSGKIGIEFLPHNTSW